MWETGGEVSKALRSARDTPGGQRVHTMVSTCSGLHSSVRANITAGAEGGIVMKVFRVLGAR